MARARSAGLVMVMMLLQSPGVARADDACLRYPTFSSTAGLTLGGSAAAAGDALRLTPAQPSKIGTAWGRADLSGGRLLETTFRFKITGTGGAKDNRTNAGGDGFAFVLQAAQAPATGFGGGMLGYQGISNSIAVEFDTWANPSIGDPDGNHIGIHSRGRNRNGAWEAVARARSSDIPNLSDGATHTVRIAYAPPAAPDDPTLSIFLDDMETPKLSDSVDIAAILDLSAGPLWAGFTSATGGAYQNSDIISWALCTPAPATLVANPYLVGLHGTSPVAKAPDVTASLSTVGESPAAIAGQTIGFFTTSGADPASALICSAVTDEAGTAACAPTNEQIQDIVAGGGFVARLASMDAYVATPSDAGLVAVVPPPVPSVETPSPSVPPVETPSPSVPPTEPPAPSVPPVPPVEPPNP